MAFGKLWHQRDMAGCGQCLPGSGDPHAMWWWQTPRTEVSTEQSAAERSWHRPGRPCPAFCSSLGGSRTEPIYVEGPGPR